MQRYNPKEIEPKWQKSWEDSGIYQATEDPSKPKKYILEFFPYPSGAAMHVGHVRNYTIGDSTARFWRMNGHNVLHPMGWDAFGLPAENYAIKTGISPQTAVAQNVEHFKKQLIQMGFGYDWTREINSTDPNYYKWTQWFFNLLFKRGLAYQNESMQWWCPVDKTVLANEQVEAGKCWRCGNDVVKKSLKQWFFKITDYADRLVDDLDTVEWSDALKSMQRNWIGKSTGSEIDFALEGSDQKVTVFTTRADTIFSGAFLVLAPEHPLVARITTSDQKQAVEAYVAATLKKGDLERQIDEKEKTGVFTGAYAINPANNEKLPIWIGDFVLAGYGTGAIFGDIHDERDFSFIKKFGIPARVTVVPEDPAEAEKVINQEYAYTNEGLLVDSGEFSGMRSEVARDKIIDWLAAKNAAKAVTNYKFRDWLISRQRYWGAPIPIIHCPVDGAVAVPDDQLPVVLPEMKSYEPSGDGRSPLARVPEFVHTTCPTCGGPAERETDTMDGFACSSWYAMRFADPQNNTAPFSAEKVKFWCPTDTYIGGAEHAVMHLLYARMWTKVMYDEGLIDFIEPFTALKNQGMILAPDGAKMSKSKGNTIAPGEIIDQGYGADAIRVMELFVGPWNQQANWSVEGMGGCYRFLNRVWTITQDYIAAPAADSSEADAVVTTATHRAIKRVTADMHEFGFNTAIAALMEMVNELYKQKEAHTVTKTAAWTFAVRSLNQLLAPFAPHITEELWSQLGEDGSIHVSQWPSWEEKYLAHATMTIAVQVSGKLRGTVEVASDAGQDAIIAAAMAIPRVAEHIHEQTIKKTIFVPGKLVNFVV